MTPVADYRLDLLGLPAKIRAEIMKELLYSECPLEQDNNTTCNNIVSGLHFADVARGAVLHPAILATCRQLHDEGIGFLRANTIGLTTFGPYAFPTVDKSRGVLSGGEDWRRTLPRPQTCPNIASAYVALRCKGTSSLRLRFIVDSVFENSEAPQVVTHAIRSIARALKQCSNMVDIVIELYDLAFFYVGHSPHSPRSPTPAEKLHGRWSMLLQPFEMVRNRRTVRIRIFDISEGFSTPLGSNSILPVEVPGEPLRYLETLMCSVDPPLLDVEAVYDAVHQKIWSSGQVRSDILALAAQRDPEIETRRTITRSQSGYGAVWEIRQLRYQVKMVWEPEYVRAASNALDEQLCKRSVLELIATYADDPDGLAAFVEGVNGA